MRGGSLPADARPRHPLPLQPDARGCRMSRARSLDRPARATPRRALALGPRGASLPTARSCASASRMPRRATPCSATRRRRRSPRSCRRTGCRRCRSHSAAARPHDLPAAPGPGPPLGGCRAGGGARRSRRAARPRRRSRVRPAARDRRRPLGAGRRAQCAAAARGARAAARPADWRIGAGRDRHPGARGARRRDRRAAGRRAWWRC